MPKIITPTPQPISSSARFNRVPPGIKDIYKKVLKENKILICYELDYAFPTAYKISVFEPKMIKELDLKVIVDLKKYHIVSYIFHNGNITEVREV